MESIKSFTDNNLSFYRTTHYFEQYGEFYTVDQFHEYCNWAKANNTKVYILGNGSNTLFTRKRVKSLVLKNKLHKKITALPGNRLEVSSSTLIIDVLKYCYENSLESFYYLASVPATIGGALAMNAGRGREHQLTIYDFVETINFFDFESNCIKTFAREDIVKGYRETIFTGIQSRLILSATFKFTNLTLKKNPIVERCKWSKTNQDYSAPNCGSVFKKADFDILNKLKGFSFGGAAFSSKTGNWILNTSNSSIPIVILIHFVKILHFMKREIAALEIITVD
ncbi:FAD-binding protein [Dendronalium sp. ChiSLP03b]|uniref:FAD-binding protein n=1 Tax=Dendronalium sp. ChiSLP03b TaxID=3075381 RepID=UPI002AD3BB13|nr:FAD-binding protein [Dendronalium sp. ChiSLP03b]MDZ8202858.1 FAD-binding protein [Dendronalium sp. ChiSLP03b]